MNSLTNYFKAAIYCTLLLLGGSFTAHAASVEFMQSSLSQHTPFKPALLYVTGSQDSERAFINMARAGAEKARKDLGIELEEFRVPENEDGTTFISDIAAKGFSPIVAVGYQNVLPVLNLAQKFPKTHFTVIDGLVPPLYNNVQSVIFKDHEGAFLVGMIAAYTSKNNHIGFVGGMDVPIIRNFGLGYVQGAKFVRPTIEVDIDMVGDTPAAWSQPDIAYDLAVKQFNKGADIIFAAAGGSGFGALRAAKDEGKWDAGIKSLGVKESALDFAVDEYNKHLVTDDLIEQVLITRERIINGLIDVEMYSPN